MNDAERKLVEALRSGRYGQATGQLRRGDAFCCLGVACDLFDPAAWQDEDGTWLHLDSADADLPEPVRLWLGWLDSEGETVASTLSLDHSAALTELNDAGFTFSQIADLIEAGLVVKP